MTDTTTSVVPPNPPTPQFPAGVGAGVPAPAPARSELSLLSPPVRYGFAVAATVFGAYVFIQPLTFSGFASAMHMGDPSFAVLSFARVAFAVVVAAGSLLMLPGGVVGRVVGAVLVAVAIPMYAALFTARLVGELRVSGPIWTVFFSTYTAPVFVVVLAWLIARARSPYAYFLLLLTLLPGFVELGLMLNGSRSPEVELIMVPVTAAVGLGIVWLAALISRRRTPAL